jgi:hypothetical protein
MFAAISELFIKSQCVGDSGMARIGMGVEMSEFASISYAATAFVPIANCRDFSPPAGIFVHRIGRRPGVGIRSRGPWVRVRVPSISGISARLVSGCLMV